MKTSFIVHAALIACLICGFLVPPACSKVLELTDRFIELKKDGMWLVMFYAPWCAHCKRLEPIWNHVAQSLVQTNIRVGRLDCTRFPTVPATFQVNGFPTILFVKDNIEFVFKGDRTKEELINFAIRLSGPPIQQITRSGSIDHVKATNDIFFLYAGDYKGDLWDAFLDVAERHQANSFFYCSPHNLVKPHFPCEAPAILVYKENVHYQFEFEPEKDLNHSLSKWVNEERFMAFPKITRGNLHQFFQIDKYIAITVLEENKLEEMASEMLEFRDMVEGVVRSHRHKYHKHFQFGWVGSPELANSLAIQVLPLPHLMVVNPSTLHHHLPDDDPLQMTPHAVAMFLDTILDQSAPVFGGNSYWVQLFRMYFEAKTTLSNMWQGNPVLTAVLFGLPCGFLTLICYSICCADIMDADDDDEDDENHEKNE